MRDAQRIEENNIASRNGRSAEELLPFDARMIEPPVDGQETIPHGGKILPLASIGEQLERKRGTAACAVPP